MEEKRNLHIKEHLITAIISLIIGGIIFMIFVLCSNKAYVHYCNAVGLAGICLICFGGLYFIARCGFFDFASYGFKQLGSQLFSKNPNQFNDFPGYREDKRVKRESLPKTYLTVVLVGVLFFVAYIVMSLMIGA